MAEDKFESLSKGRIFIKNVLINPLINYLLPRKFLLHLLKTKRSPLLEESIRAPGGWRSMHLSYENAAPVSTLDKLVLRFGIFPMGLRNRKRMMTRILKDLIHDFSAKGHVHIVGVGAGPGTNVIEAMAKAERDNVTAYCLDLDDEAFPHGEILKKRHGLEAHRVKYIKGNAVELEKHVKVTPHIIKLIGILEYLSDKEAADLLRFAHRALDTHGAVVTHSIYNRHGHERFMKHFLNLKLNYRSVSHVSGMLEAAGFSIVHEEMEPLGIYAAIVGRK